jgi:hypothetical protein
MLILFTRFSSFRHNLMISFGTASISIHILFGGQNQYFKMLQSFYWQVAVLCNGDGANSFFLTKRLGLLMFGHGDTLKNTVFSGL